MHLPFVDGIRAVAALIVLFNHIYAEVFTVENNLVPPPGWGFLSYSMVLGHLSVAVFIVISGFVLTLPTLKNDMGLGDGGLRRFFYRRARRILPPYYAALILCIALNFTILRPATGTHFDTVKQLGKTDILSHFLLLQNVFGTGKINYVFWSIATEWHIYLLFPGLLFCWRRFGGIATVTGALCVGYAAQFFFATSRLGRANLHFLGLFVMGMFAAAYVVPRLQKGSPHGLIWLRGIAVLSLLTVTTLIALWGWRDMERRFLYLDFPVACLSVYLLAEGGLSANNWVHKVFGSAPLVFVGTFSYSLYLVHVPIIALLLLYVANPLNLTSLAGFAFFSTVGVAGVLAGSYGFHQAFERPFMNTKPAPPKVI